MVQACFHNRKINIFTYGQTGCGKSFTLFGLDNNVQDKIKIYENRGLLFRSIELIFNLIEKNRKSKRYFKLYFSAQ